LEKFLRTVYTCAAPENWLNQPRAQSLASRENIAHGLSGCKRKSGFGNTLRRSVAAMQRRDKIPFFQGPSAPKLRRTTRLS
jgi:hypothetical protein